MKGYSFNLSAKLLKTGIFSKNYSKYVSFGREFIECEMSGMREIEKFNDFKRVEMMKKSLFESRQRGAVLVAIFDFG